MSTSQRRPRGPTRPNSRLQRKRRRSTTSTPMATQTETIELEENADEEVVDLTCESVSDAVVLDLTNNDSVVVSEKRRSRRRRNRTTRGHPDSYVLSSGDEDSEGDVCVASTVSAYLNTLENGTAGPRPPGTVSCPICMDVHTEITQSGRVIVATKCGHIFCSQCLRDAMKNSSTCPTCRKKLTHKQYHPIYI
ncbi:E3 ubiquitin-protein ligase RNF4 isoform X2 [Lissotriton helveticus]